ncbi:MAG: thiamine pyrophosphate-dependent dehydrogenase E1 component subunit alpha, partial [Chloroflexi bacterium]|nr:thiamine pyrophosphate-dependent dehydrogenase E1 component subunit alpha [Chloroflexota bacterium]
VDEWRQRDPIPILRDLLMELGEISVEEDEEIRRCVRAEVDEAQRYAEEAPVAMPEDALLHVYGESPESVSEG